MKKIIGLSSIVAASILSVAFAFIIVPTAHAQTACPAGFICTPITTQPVNCPAGFICTPVSTGNEGGSGGGGGGSSSSCYTWSAYLGIGSRGADVVALQTWLISQGYNIPLISLSQTSKGYFGAATAAAVKELQTAIGQTPTGSVGAQLIAYLNQNSCGTTTGVNNNGNTGTTPGNTTGTTPGNSTTYTGPDEYTQNYTVNFTKSFNVSNTSSPVTLTMAADNYYTVTVNGTNIASTPSTGDSELG
ncbi:MAG: peptidoglycan-binding domain-containing protein, partial [Candidatus Pacebacteria bacterium]|nr:peptidoglycan-binding domain-containing protein [Candidatus Paceibacterota bacterium]